MQNHQSRCHTCKRMHSLEILDGKPPSAKFRLEAQRLGQFEALSRAADRGEDFSRLECPRDYGAGYLPI